MTFRTLRAKVMDEVLVFMKSKGVQSFGAVTWHLFGYHTKIGAAWDGCCKKTIKSSLATSQRTHQHFTIQFLDLYKRWLSHADTRIRKIATCEKQTMWRWTNQCKPFDYLFADILIDLYIYILSIDIDLSLYPESIGLYRPYRLYYIVRSYWLARSSDRLVSTFYIIVSISLI